MDYIALLKRAFWITVKYRALWIFGFFLALCSASGSGGGGSSGGGGNPTYPGDSGVDPGNFGMPFAASPEAIWWTVGSIIAAVCCLILLLVVIGFIVRAVTRTALIGMVDQIEETKAVTIKEGWHFGWSKRAWITFLISFIITVPLVIIFGSLLLVALLPLALIFFESTPLTILGIVAAVGLMLLWILAVIAVALIVTPLQELAWRYAVLRQMGAIDSLKAGYALIRQNLQDVAIVVLLMIGTWMAWAIISIILAILVLLLALALGIIPGIITFLISGTWWMGLLVGILLVIILMILPLTFMQGLYLIFHSTVWTLTFRELQAKTKPSEPESLEETTDETKV